MSRSLRKVILILNWILVIYFGLFLFVGLTIGGMDANYDPLYVIWGFVAFIFLSLTLFWLKKHK